MNLILDKKLLILGQKKLMIVPPKKIGDSFSMTEIRQRNIKRNFLRNGKSYTVFSWPVGLTAAMAGNQELSFEVAIQVRVKNNRSSPFNDPFLSDPFFGFGREQALIASTEKQTIEVRSLPMKGRPQDFQGAIGSFSFFYEFGFFFYVCVSFSCENGMCDKGIIESIVEVCCFGWNELPFS